MRILGVDYGRRRIGIAVSDHLGMAAHGRPTLAVQSVSQAVAAVAAQAEDLGVERIIVGLPLNMDGSRGQMASAVEAFARSLEARVAVPIVLWDERLTSVQAHRALQESGGKHDKGSVDRLAAVFLLDSFLQAQQGAAPRA